MTKLRSIPALVIAIATWTTVHTDAQQPSYPLPPGAYVIPAPRQLLQRFYPQSSRITATQKPKSQTNLSVRRAIPVAEPVTTIISRNQVKLKNVILKSTESNIKVLAQKKEKKEKSRDRELPKLKNKDQLPAPKSERKTHTTAKTPKKQPQPVASTQPIAKKGSKNKKPSEAESKPIVRRTEPAGEARFVINLTPPKPNAKVPTRSVQKTRPATERLVKNTPPEAPTMPSETSQSTIPQHSKEKPIATIPEERAQPSGPNYPSHDGMVDITHPAFKMPVTVITHPSETSGGTSMLGDLILGQLDATLSRMNAPITHLADNDDTQFPSLLENTPAADFVEPPAAYAVTTSMKVSDSNHAKLNDEAAKLEQTPAEKLPLTPISGSKVDIQSDRQADYDKENNCLTFTGNVGLDNPRFRLRSEKLVVFLKEDSSGLQRAEASSNVVVEVIPIDGSARTTASAGIAIFDPETDELTLTGWPKAVLKGRQNEATTSSTKMILSTQTGQFSVAGPNRFVTGG